MYAGEGKGADIAAWRQAARSEAAILKGNAYAQLLLDLVKASASVRHWLLVREALKLGYPLMTLRLSLAAYSMGRILKVGEALSQVLNPIRGIRAGSGFATYEMRLAMITVVDKARVSFSMVHPTLFAVG